MLTDKFLSKASEYGILEETQNLINGVKNQKFENKTIAKKQTGVSYLLGIDSSYKTQKGSKVNYLTGILYLAAANNSGVNICPSATDGCKKACLFFTGRAAFLSKNQKISNVNKCRFLRTVLFFVNRSYFMDWLFYEIKRAQVKANKENKKLAIRLNGTSDINIKTFKNSEGINVLDKFENIQFYDYTKLVKQLDNVRINYDVTFSYGGFSNLVDVVDCLEKGIRVSIPFDLKDFGGLPETFMNVPIVNGDETDLTFLAPSNVVWGLKFKTPHKRNVNEDDKKNDFLMTKKRKMVIES